MCKKASAVILGQHLSKTSVTSSQVDEETASQIHKKKGYRIPLENVPIRPKPTALVMPSREASIENNKDTQTRNSGCHCFPISSKGTCVKVCTIAECATKQDTCTWCRNHFLLNTWGTCYYLDVHPYFHLHSCVSSHSLTLIFFNGGQMATSWCFVVL